MSFIEELINRGKDLIGWGEAKPPSETEAVKRDSFDRGDYQHVLNTAPAIRDLQTQLEQTVDYAADLLADLHSGLFKVDPQVRPAEEMRPTHVANAAVMDKLLGTPEMQALRMHTTGDAYTSAIGMLSMQDVTLEALTSAHEAAKAETEAEAERQEAREKRQKEIEELIKDLAENPPPPPLPPGEEGPERAPDPRVDGLKTQLDQFGQMPVPSNGGIQQAAEQAAAGMDRKLRAQAKQATQELDEEMALMSAFGVEPGELQRMSVEERMKLAAKLKSNRLAAFAKLLGQFRMVQQAESRKRVIDAASEVHGITTGSDLTRITASELLNFADPSLETLMWARWSEDQMSIWDVRGRENLGQGPIICVVDESGSMGATDVAGGTREAWSKALSLALLEQAKHRKRDFVYIGFSSAGQQRVVEFNDGVTPMDKVIEMCEGFLNGGTNFEQPLTMALKIMEEQFDALAKPRPDIVMITDDAYGDMDPKFMTEWNRVRDKTSLKCYGIAVGTIAGRALNAVSDNVREITSLTSDPRQMADIFRTI